MNWIILFVIIFVVTLVIFAVCGVGGGMMTLVILNGYMTIPTPAAVMFTSSLLCTSILIPALFGWLFVKARKAEEIRFWHVVGATVGANIILSLFGLVIFFVARLIN